MTTGNTQSVSLDRLPVLFGVLLAAILLMGYALSETIAAGVKQQSTTSPTIGGGLPSDQGSGSGEPGPPDLGVGGHPFIDHQSDGSSAVEDTGGTEGETDVTTNDDQEDDSASQRESTDEVTTGDGADGVDSNSESHAASEDPAGPERCWTIDHTLAEGGRIIVTELGDRYTVSIVTAVGVEVQIAELPKSGSSWRSGECRSKAPDVGP